MTQEMQFKLSKFTLFPPDAISSHWWVMDDFAEFFGVEYSKEACQRMKVLFADAGVRLDYEADGVTLVIPARKNVIPVLRMLYAELEWDASELDEIESQVESFRRPKPLQISEGDVFRIPIEGNLYGLGQILSIRSGGAPTVCILRWHGPQEDTQGIVVSSLQPLTILHTLGASLRTGEWQIISNQEVTLDPDSGPCGPRRGVGSRSFGGDGPVIPLLRGFAEIDTWEQEYHDPDYLRKLLMK